MKNLEMYHMRAIPATQTLFPLSHGFKQGDGVSYMTPNEKTNMRPYLCLLGSLTDHSVRDGHRKIRKSLKLFNACAEMLNGRSFTQTPLFIGLQYRSIGLRN